MLQSVVRILPGFKSLWMLLKCRYSNTSRRCYARRLVMPQSVVRMLLKYQILLALEYLHINNPHRDLKPGSILTSDCSIAGLKFKLADFGLLKIFNLSQPALTNCGTKLLSWLLR
jgi:serine/threonine protein kinase